MAFRAIASMMEEESSDFIIRDVSNFLALEGKGDGFYSRLGLYYLKNRLVHIIPSSVAWVNNDHG